MQDIESECNHAGLPEHVPVGQQYTHLQRSHCLMRYSLDLCWRLLTSITRLGCSRVRQSPPRMQQPISSTVLLLIVQTQPKLVIHSAAYADKLQGPPVPVKHVKYIC